MDKQGRLIAFVGPMGSGKTTTLINLYNDFKKDGKKVLAIKPIIDTRYDENKIVSHDGLEIPCIAVETGYDIAFIEGIEEYDAILIDEMQFFDDFMTIAVLEAIVNCGIDVYVFGLDLNSEGTVFGLMGEILAHADEVFKLKTKCHKCGADARISMYIKGEKESEILIGGLDVYKPTCRNCYYNIDEETLSIKEYIEEIEKEEPILVNIKGDGFEASFTVTEEELEEAGYTLEEVQDINSIEGLMRLFEDLGYSYGDGEINE